MMGRVLIVGFWLGWAGMVGAGEYEIGEGETGRLRGEPDAAGEFVFWLPPGADELVVPVSGGVVVDTGREDLMGWLRGGSPWSLLELPVFGVRYGEVTVVVILPWPHYARLVVGERTGVRFFLPEGRRDVAPVEVVVMQGGRDAMDVARRFREWRATAVDLGAIPRARRLGEKLKDLRKVERLLGAPHFYLWGPYMQERVGGILGEVGYSAWFVDCDATGECFDDYRDGRRATKLDDLKLRRERLRWLEDEKGVVVGSEGGSVLFSDVPGVGGGADGGV